MEGEINGYVIGERAHADGYEEGFLRCLEVDSVPRQDADTVTERAGTDLLGCCRRYTAPRSAWELDR